jgi:DNA polymerase-3 subunit delta'
MKTILPWHQSLWQQALASWQQDHLAHALLLCGSQGMGKAQFARNFAETILCEAGQACGKCKACHLLNAGTHPDFLEIEIAGKSNIITVDQIRSFIQYCTLTSNYGGYQIAILNPAEAMNANASNSLLKLLEEPPAKTLIMLISHQPMALSATIRSRCQRLDFSRPDKKLTVAWLQNQLSSEQDAELLLNLSAQAPLAALALAQDIKKRGELFQTLNQLVTNKEDPIKIAQQWNKGNPKQILEWMNSWIMDMIRYSLSTNSNFIINKDIINPLQNIAKQFDLQALFKILDLQTEAYGLITAQTNIKPQGLLESIAIAWHKKTQMSEEIC